LTPLVGTGVEVDGINVGFGNKTVFLAHGWFLGETLFAEVEGLIGVGEIDLNWILDRARTRTGGVLDSYLVPLFCEFFFSLVRLARRGVWYWAMVGFNFVWIGVFGTMEILDSVSAVETNFFANWLAWRISTTVSPNSIAGNEVCLQSPVHN
jgi:hypothetical protein